MGVATAVPVFAGTPLPVAGDGSLPAPRSGRTASRSAWKRSSRKFCRSCAKDEEPVLLEVEVEVGELAAAALVVAAVLAALDAAAEVLAPELAAVPELLD